MNKILIFIVVSAFLLFLAYLILKLLKKDKLNIKLIVLSLIASIVTLFYLICYPQNEILNENYFLGIAQMTGGLFTVIGVYMTIKEEEKIRKSDEENFDNKIKEQLRLENLPVLKFSCNNDEKSVSGIVEYVDCTSEEETTEIQLNIDIKNVGLGSAQKIWFQSIIGIKNDNSMSGIENQIIEPKEKITNTIYFRIPKNKTEFNKRLTILVFYSDLLNNKYMQKLDGNISISECENDGEITYYPHIHVSADKDYEKIGENYKYEIPQEIIEEELNRIKEEEKYKDILKRIPDKPKIDELINEYLRDKNSFCEIIKETLNSSNYEGGDGITDYRKVKGNIYEVTITGSMGISRREYVKYEWLIRVNVKTEAVKTIDKKITKSTLKIKKRVLNKLKRKIAKELKQIKKEEEKDI